MPKLVKKEQPERVQITQDNSHVFTVKFLETIVSQNKIMIQHLASMAGMLSKLPSNDINGEEKDGKPNN